MSRGLAATLCVAAVAGPAYGQGIYYNEVTGETVTSDGRAAFIRDIPMPMAPPLLPPNQRRRTIIIVKRPELRYIVKHWVDHRRHHRKAARPARAERKR